MDTPAEAGPGPAIPGVTVVGPPLPPARPVVAAIRAGLVGFAIELVWITWFLVGAGLLATIIVSVPAAVLLGDRLETLFDMTTAGWLLAQVGPLPSLYSVAQVVAMSAYVGWYLPGRVAVASGWTIGAARRGVAIVGFVLSALILWLVPMDLDIVLVVGCALAPFAFVIAALRAPMPPVHRLNRRGYFALAGILVLGMILVLIAFRVASSPSLTLDLSAAGEPASAVGISPDDVDTTTYDMDPRFSAPGTILETTAFWGMEEPIPSGGRFTSAAVEVWPADVRDGVLRLEGPPIAGATGVVPLPTWDLDWSMPTPRDRQFVATIGLGITEDGRRIILDADPRIQLTPWWHGPILLWWLGG